MIMVQLLTHQRLDITLDSAERCQTLYDMLMLIKTRPSDTDQFPRHQPKIGIARPDPTAAYLTPNDTPSNLEFNPFQASSIVPSTPSRKRVMITRSTAVSEQIHKKTRVQHSEESSTSYRQSKESYDKILSSPPGGPEVTPDRWRPPSSPTCRGDEVTTPRRAESLRQTLDQLERFGCITSPVPKPQFHSIVPTPRVLRSMNDKTRRYGREVGLRNSKRLSSLDRSSTSGCIAAVLQAMFSLDPVAKDLQDPYWLRLSGVQLGLFRSLVDAFAPYSKSQVLDIREETVSNNVVKTTKGSLGDEDDAREFLRDALNQVRQEFRERNVDTACPLSRLFECDIEHTLVCMICGNESVHTEHYQDFRLEVPLCDNNRSNQTTMSIGGLFPQMFDAQQISFECEACQSDNAMVRRSISKLPEILVVHLKRFTPRLPHGCNKNRNIVTIDETLEFSQFCSLAAFSTDISDSVQTQYSDDDRTFRRPHIPSDNFPSSESSRFSSISPMRHDNPFGSFSPPIDYLDASLHNPQGEGTAGNPFWLNSDDEDLHDVSANQSYSFYEAPSEDEQYRWALEESVRESKSLSQESTLNGDRDIFRSEDVLKEGDLDAQIFGTNNTSLKGQFTDRSHDLTVEDEGKSVLKKSRSFTKDSSNNSSQDRYQPDGEDEHPDKKEAVDDEDEDKQIKAAIRASLMPDQNYTPDDKERIYRRKSVRGRRGRRRSGLGR
ncbi:hypothetical protein BC939DRAFT_52008 [Gamsiella multidivaricata]|uniref:uncharacterized protein n=1 Tax=Gamsiella multidivaricata TaxID=101098 RepID=UPI00221E57B6|nr:uncharacterized protein BC939DRAFT_52008 [Gamsiella multidivaricata]KAI7828853.1 hypothetical protein BC939DRAFT_52008 [Gamsiella multidivaricata]